MPLPNYLIFYKEIKKDGDSIQIRKLNDPNEVGIQITKKLYDFPFSTSAEFFLTEKTAMDMIKALKEYFKI